MLRKIIGNLIIGALVPILAAVRWWPNVYKAVVFGVYEYYDFHIESLSELLYYALFEHYLLLYILFLFFALIPFQLIKDRYYSKGKRLSLWKKCLILSGFIVFWFAFIFLPPITEMKERLILFGCILAIGAIIASILYVVVDRYVEPLSANSVRSIEPE